MAKVITPKCVVLVISDRLTLKIGATYGVEGLNQLREEGHIRRHLLRGYKNPAVRSPLSARVGTVSWLMSDI